ncbi:MAG TPA: N-acetylglucosamine-6-phosphate deacetylase [Verrucomicrobiae bacterium]
MKDGELIAWHYATRQPVRVRWADGKFTALEVTDETPPRDLWIAPPLVDLQINGYAGVDFQQDNLSANQLLRAARGLRAAGCARFLLALITDVWPKLMARLRHVRELRAQSAELQKSIAGWHVEGPFLSAEPGFCGAHEPTVMCDPTPQHIHELRRVTGNDPVLLTVAPERDNAIAAIALAASLGLKVSLGHTNAPQKRLVQAIKAGATGFTHLANGCPRLLDRHDNILWRLFETPGLMVSLIPDQIHVSPALFRLIHRTMASGSIYYTTDAMSAAGAPPGRYQIGRLEVEVEEDQIVRQPGSPLFAGSALRPIDGVFRAAQMLDCAWQEAWGRCSDAPARFMGFSTGLQLNDSADFCLLQVSPENRLEELRVYLGGEVPS